MGLFRRIEATGCVDSLQPTMRSTARHDYVVVEAEAREEDWDLARGQIWILHEGLQISGDVADIGEPARGEGQVEIMREGDRISSNCDGEIIEPVGDERQIGDVTTERTPEIGV
ncbi:hypothetical protein TIFTF001_016410 [Ficus carica]|uniref:Uncharacterized protein n=1 Tax=Ficus carica TaxID=3494 RepID=A0AA88A7J0_FICCA|nr:hypothetical protein TIFTF001_016410 [Ficus carica]